jgi:hypothetical protein
MDTDYEDRTEEVEEEVVAEFIQRKIAETCGDPESDDLSEEVRLAVEVQFGSRIWHRFFPAKPKLPARIPTTVLANEESFRRHIGDVFHTYNRKFSGNELLDRVHQVILEEIAAAEEEARAINKEIPVVGDQNQIISGNLVA